MEGRTTREQLVEMLADDPDVTAPEAAKRLGVSRQRIHQIARSEGLALARVYSCLDGTRRRLPAVQTGGIMSDPTATMKGTVAELVVAAELLSWGYQVFIPVTRHTAGCDLITLTVSGDVERIEVKTGRRLASGSIRHTDIRHRHFDRLAIVLHGEPVVYQPAFRPEDRL